MCEILALSAGLPATVNVSLRELAAHGSATSANHDGWGIAYYEDRAVRVVKEAEPAASSDWVRFIESHQLRSHTVIAHVRHASRGGISFENTQPFDRELGGRAHVFAHNGNLENVERLRLTYFRPMGETDSELAFCSLLGMLAPAWSAGQPSLEERVAVVQAFAETLRTMGPANFIYADGELLFVHGDRRAHAEGEPARPPGLHVLERFCSAGDETRAGGGVAVGPHPDEEKVVLAASVPLTADEMWRPLSAGQLLVLANGRIMSDTVAT